MISNQTLLFVYNADGDLFNTVSDFVHKIISTKTYDCKLCALTFGNFSMHHQWKDFLKHLNVQQEFLHRDEFLKQYESHRKEKLPAVFWKNYKGLTMLLSANEINGAASLEQLQLLLTMALRDITQIEQK